MENNIKKAIAAAANTLRNNYGNDCCNILRDTDCGAISGAWYRLHPARVDNIDPRDVWAFDPDCGNCAADFDLSIVDRRYFTIGKSTYAIITYNHPLLHLRPQIGPAAPVPAADLDEWRRLVRDLDFLYAFTVGGDDSRFIAGSTSSDRDYDFTVDGNTYTARDRTPELAAARWAVDVGRRAGLIQRG